jgi:hypothetical protein
VKIGVQSFSITLALAVLLLSSGVAAETATAPSEAESNPFPISLAVDSPITLVRHEVAFTGKTIALLSNDVSLDIEGSKTSPPQSNVIKGTAGLDGKFTLHFTPTVAGLYTAVVTAPDHRGTSTTQFRVVDPASATDTRDLTQAIPRLVRYVPRIFEQINTRLDDLPPSPAKDKLKRNLQGVIKRANDLELPANDVANDLNTLLTGKWTIDTNPDATAQRIATERLKRIEADRLKVVQYLGEVESWEFRSKEELESISKRAVFCDNLEVVQEGINIVGLMLNLFEPQTGKIVSEFADDIAGDQVGSAVNSITDSNLAGFGASQAVKQRGVAESLLKKEAALVENASGFVGLLNDEIGLGVSLVVSQACVVFSGPVKAHMHAKFFHEGRMWWEYAFDVQGQLTLHYPRSASGGSVPLKGRIEGFATNYKVWEDSLDVMFPGLMSSTFQTRFQILPITASNVGGALTVMGPSGADNFTHLRNVEGSLAGYLATPSSFFFEVTGTATASQLTVKLGSGQRDTNDAATIVVLGVPVLTLSPMVWVYPLPFKPVHFVFEKAARGDIVIPLTTEGETVKGKRDLKNDRASMNGEAEGEYTAEFQVCNPGC